MRNQTAVAAPSPVTRAASGLIGFIMMVTVIYLAASFRALPDLLPVHFHAEGMPDGWQFKTVPRVMLPFFVQAALAVTLGGVGALLLSRGRSDANRDALSDRDSPLPEPPDVRAARIATEGVFLIALVWVAFQAYAAWALVQMWSVERAGLGSFYNYLEVAGGILTLAIAARTNQRLGRPSARPYVESHWRLGQLYKNPDDPALFVPTRDGRRWTLNFGRPVAAALLALVLLLGVVGPFVILAVLLR